MPLPPLLPMLLLLLCTRPTLAAGARLPPDAIWAVGGPKGGRQLSLRAPLARVQVGAMIDLSPEGSRGLRFANRSQPASQRAELLPRAPPTKRARSELGQNCGAAAAAEAAASAPSGLILVVRAAH